MLANGFGSRDEIGLKIGLTSKENRALGDRDLSLAARLNGRHDVRTSWSGELLDHLSRQEPRRKGGR